MAQLVERAASADVCDLWVGTEPVTRRNKRLPVGAHPRGRGVVAEMGIGDGRIAIEAARPGRPIAGASTAGAGC